MTGARSWARGVLYLAGLAACAAPASAQTYLWPEAGTVPGPIQVQVADLASGSRYIQVAPGNNSPSAAPATGQATYAFTLSAAGTYRVWGRTIAPANTDDSFWVRMDAGSWINWN